jgi:hypothetical protein
MHVEPLEKLPRSVREFLSHYSMIVLSILTALALEQVALGMEHRHEGRRAKEEIQQEIASNRAVVEASLKATRENAQAWGALYARALADIKSGASTDESRVAALRDASGLFRDALPSLKTTAWDAAISDHAVNYLDHADLTRYSELYTFERLFQQAMWDTLRDSGVHDLSSLSMAVAMGKATPDQTITVLNSRLRTLEILESQMAQIGEALKQAGGEEAGGPSVAEAASSTAVAPSRPAPAAATSH